MNKNLKEGKYMIRRVGKVIKIAGNTYANSFTIDNLDNKSIIIKWSNHDNKTFTGIPFANDIVIVNYINGELEIKYESGQSITSKDVKNVIIDIEE